MEKPAKVAKDLPKVAKDLPKVAKDLPEAKPPQVAKDSEPEVVPPFKKKNPTS